MKYNPLPAVFCTCSVVVGGQKLRSVFVLTLLLMVSVACGTQPSLAKQKTIHNVLAALSRVEKISMTSAGAVDDPKIGGQLKAIAGSIESLDELAKIAVICRVLAYPQEAGDLQTDNIYDAMFWACVVRLSSIPGADATSALEEIERLYPLQGGDRTWFRDLLADQKARRN